MSFHLTKYIYKIFFIVGVLSRAFHVDNHRANMPKLKRFRGECQTIAGGWGERGSILHQRGDHPHKSKLHMGRFETIGSSYTWILEYSSSIANSKNSWSKHIGFGI
jgi:hypothetical protein